MRSTSEGISLPAGTQMGLFVVFVSPSLFSTMIHMFSCSTKTTGFTCTQQKLHQHLSRKYQRMLEINSTGLTSKLFIQRMYVEKQRIDRIKNHASWTILGCHDGWLTPNLILIKYSKIVIKNSVKQLLKLRSNFVNSFYSIFK